MLHPRKLLIYQQQMVLMRKGHWSCRWTAKTRKFNTFKYTLNNPFTKEHTFDQCFEKPKWIYQFNRKQTSFLVSLAQLIFWHFLLF
jgi:hypothetical protein